MLQQVRFKFTIELISFTHVGDGRQFSDSVCKKDETSAEVQSIQRGKNNLPVIEASSVRGAMKVHLKQYGQYALAESLFGKDEIESVGGDGCLRLHTGVLANRAEMEKWLLMLPFWNKLQGRPFSFVLPGIRIDRPITAATGAVATTRVQCAELRADAVTAIDFHTIGLLLGMMLVVDAGAEVGASLVREARRLVGLGTREHPIL